MAEERQDYAAAEQFYRQAIAADPSDAESYAALGFLALRARRHPVYRELSLTANKINPRLVLRYVQRAEAAKAQRRMVDAAEAWQRALALQPDNAGLLIEVAEALLDLGRNGAAEAAQDAAARVPNNSKIQLRSAAVLAESGRLDLASSAADRALALEPANFEVPLRLGQIRRAQGKIEDAIRLFRRALELNPESGEAWLQLSDLERFRPGSQDIDRLQKLIDRLGDSRQTTPVLFALAKAYDDVGEFDRAFQYLERGNRMIASQVSYDPATDEKWAERIRRNLDRKLVREKSRFGIPSDLPVFIIGMPRSGSTLVEQISAAHPKIHGAGEIAEVGQMLNDLKSLCPESTDYIDACRTLKPAAQHKIGTAAVVRLSGLCDTATRITNKTLGNFFHVGFLSFVLPQARFIETVRDPIETCFACWRLPFRGKLAFTYDLSHLARYYKVYRQLMAHWNAVVPDRIFVCSYENLVAQQESVTRQLLSFLGLDWDRACLEFYRDDRPVLTATAAQVRRPLTPTPSQRWRNYERHLGPLLDALGPLVDDVRRERW